MTALAPYPAYRDSGVHLLGAVPADWTVQPAVTLARVLTSTVDKHMVEGEFPVRLCNYTDVYYNDVISAKASYMESTASRAQIAAFAVTAGDVVFTKDSETADDIGISAFVPISLPGLVYGYHLATYRPHDSRYGKFLKWFLDSGYAKSSFQVRTLGVTRVGLSQNTIRYLRVPTPPPELAAQIAKYLDRETAEIDAFIADQEELIALLTERRAATITHAVTKGLDPTAPMKDSGVDWVGDVPSGWDTGNIRRFAQMRTGHTPSRARDEYWTECFIPWFTLADVWQLRQGNTFLGETKSLISELGLANSAAELLPEGTVVLSRTASVGFAGIMSRPMATSQDFWNWVCGEKLLPKYLWYQFLSMRSHFSFLAQGSTHKTIYQADAAALSIVVPEIDSQRAIADYLDHETAELDAAIADAREAIALSKERRAALISAAVTGKIDVRGVA
ncbi:restriction endonuclease subunit S [Plantibacter flavus]|uniref:restriction endonuclease subunit S n=1 Tax=Plantibacter flavus TaxID=150123 RepID=UPI003F17AA48